MIATDTPYRPQAILGEVGAILIGFWHVFFCTDYSIFDKVFVQIVIPHENHVNGLFLTHTQCPEIINFDIIFALSEKTRHSGAILMPPLLDIEKTISLNSILGMLLTTFCTQLTEKGLILSKLSFL